MSSTKKNYNVFVVSRDENMRFIYEKSINNTCKETKKQNYFFFRKSKIFESWYCARTFETFEISFDNDENHDRNEWFVNVDANYC